MHPGAIAHVALQHAHTSPVFVMCLMFLTCINTRTTGICNEDCIQETRHSENKTWG